MNKLSSLAILGAMAALWATPSALADSFPLNGPHYNLTIHGGTCKNPPLTGSNRQTIFVPLVTSGDPPGGTEPDAVSPDTAIYLVQGSPFQVCDGNACDLAHACTAIQQSSIPTGAFGAVFQLPCDTFTASGTVAPCATNGASASYSIFAEALGKPGGQAQITTCATDIATNTVVCSTTSTPLLVRNTGKPKVDDVTTQLTTLTCNGATSNTPTCANLCLVKQCTFEIFAAGFNGFFWDYDNLRLKNLQMRFYLNPS